MKRTILALTAALLLGSALLTACSSDSASSEASQAASAEAASQEAASQDTASQETLSQPDPDQGESSGSGAPRPTSSAPNSMAPEDLEEIGASEEEIPEELRAIAGVWNMTKNTIGDQEIDLSESATTYYFLGDRTFYIELMGENIGEGTYTFDGSTVTIDLNGADPLRRPAHSGSRHRGRKIRADLPQSLTAHLHIPPPVPIEMGQGVT